MGHHTKYFYDFTFEDSISMKKETQKRSNGFVAKLT